MTLSSKDIKRILERHGFVLSRQRGSHQQFVNEAMILRSGATVNHRAELIPSFNHKHGEARDGSTTTPAPRRRNKQKRLGTGLNFSG